MPRWAIIAAAGAALVACSTIPAVSSDWDSDNFYAGQAEADAALELFDKSNPDCQLWTNWQKMCSRSGPSGSVYCASDASRPVSPSAPVCVAWSVGNDRQLAASSRREQLSRARFCRGELIELEDDGGSALCTSPDPQRPFSGRDLSARRHPYCTVWAEEHTGAPVCAEGSAFPELPRCAALAEAGHGSRQPLYCANENSLAIADCNEPRGLFGRRRGVNRPFYPPEQQDDESSIIAVSDKEDDVLSVYCERK